MVRKSRTFCTDPKANIRWIKGINADPETDLGFQFLFPSS